ncbi:SH3 domain-containing protein [Devosia sp. 2618]|uniref:SH3 domain-containing protein n=1 Tax=Devosia sp. 2618 TaxID=3156454 RepID=UPI003392BCC9
MNKQQEKVLVAALCGMVMVAAGAFAVQPAMAAGYNVAQVAQVTGVAHWDKLNVRKWPAAYSQQVGALNTGSQVWVERCIEANTGADWCLVHTKYTQGWVNSRYLSAVSN